MRVEVIAIGDELLIGQTINTNASWMGQLLATNGGTVQYATVVQDTEEAILDAVDHALNRVDVVLMTGGLGPTKDDITKHTLCKYFETSLAINEEVLARITHFFEIRGREMLEVNRQQAALPIGSTTLLNDQGTASGMWFEKDGKILVSMPGVPYEMKHLMVDKVLPKLKERFEMKAMYHRTLHLQGIGESFLAEKISDIEDRIHADGIGLAYLPSPGIVRLRLTSNKEVEKERKIEQYLKELEARLPKHAFGREEDQLSGVVGSLLKRKGMTLGCVESCTAGALSSEVVSIPGASAYFMGSIVSYSNALKANFVGVPMDFIENHGAVSEEVVKSMAANGRQLLGVDYCLSISGVAGPDGGSEEKPVGTVWIGLASANKLIAKRFLFGDQRDRNIRMSVLAALNMLRCDLLEIKM